MRPLLVRTASGGQGGERGTAAQNRALPTLDPPLTPVLGQGMPAALRLAPQASRVPFWEHTPAATATSHHSAAVGLGGLPPVCLLGGEEDSGVVGGMVTPQGIEDPHPQVGQRTHRDGVTLALLPLAPAGGLGPRLLCRAVPSEGVQGVAQRLDAGAAPAHRGIGAALPGPRRRAGQRLQARRTGVAGAVVAHLSQQPRGQPLPTARQNQKEGGVGVGAKELGNRRIVGRDLRQQGL